MDAANQERIGLRSNQKSCVTGALWESSLQFAEDLAPDAPCRCGRCVRAAPNARRPAHRYRVCGARNRELRDRQVGAANGAPYIAASHSGTTVQRLRGEIRSKMFRHTYCAARLQTLDNGAPVSVYTVAKELGHGGDALVKRVYGHLGEVRHRADVVEYRVKQHKARLGARLRLLRSA